MPFIDKHKLLFIHIPKTGGTSIEEKFGVNNTRNELYSNKNAVIDGILMAKQHWLPRIIERNFPHRFRDYKKFVIVRNPYVRVISEYFYQFPGQRVSFNDFVLNKLNPKERDHYLPQHLYFEDIKYDYVLRTESLNEDFSKMSRDFSFDDSLKRSNKRGEGSEKRMDLLTPEIIKKINSLYEKDFKMFEYEMK